MDSEAFVVCNVSEIVTSDLGFGSVVEEKDIFGVVRCVQNLLELGTLSVLDGTAHWVWHNEESNAVEKLSFRVQVPESDDRELFAVHVGTIDELLRVTFFDFCVVVRCDA